LVRVAADGVPKFGVVSAGLVANTNAPLPVSSDTALAKLADEGVAKNVATLAPKPLMPVETGNPVQLVNVPELGVPRTGVTKVGDVANTSAPDPVSSVTAVLRLADDGVAKNVLTPVPNPLIPVLTGSPVQFVSVPEVGVPKIGVVKLGDVADKVTPLIVPPVMVAPEDTSVFSVAVLEADKAVNAPVLAVDAPIGVLLIDPPAITGFVRVFPDKATPVIEPPVITGAVIVYVPSRIPSPTSRICAIISRIVSFTPEGNIPSGAPFGGAALLFAGVREYFVYAMIFLDYNFILLF
jgi:hypothetical protein